MWGSSGRASSAYERFLPRPPKKAAVAAWYGGAPKRNPAVFPPPGSIFNSHVPGNQNEYWMFTDTKSWSVLPTYFSLPKKFV